MKLLHKSGLWLVIVLATAVWSLLMGGLFHPALGIATVTVGWLLLLQNESGEFRLAPDKRRHWAAGFVLTLVLLPSIGELWAGLTCCAIAALKELWDGRNKGATSFADFLWTCAGGLLALQAWLLIRQWILPLA
jgi:hypothetical protein